ncbi:MAG: DUF1493 family protein [Cupriavidus sp.]|nr:DUF1493 family protein [Cupriavidus sp.]
MGYTCRITLAALNAFIRENTRLPQHRRISRTDSLEGDLSLSGDEALDFMEKYFEHFRIERGNYAFQRYFSEEGFNLVEILATPFSKRIRQKYERLPLTVGMLEQAIEAGIWETP